MMPKMGAVGRDKYACSTGSLLMLCTELSLGDASMIMGHDTGSTYDRIARSFRTHCGALGWISRQALFYLMCLSRGALSPCGFLLLNPFYLVPSPFFKVLSTKSTVMFIHARIVLE